MIHINTGVNYYYALFPVSLIVYIWKSSVDCFSFILSRRAVDSLKQLREQHRFMKGLFVWIGYPQKAIPYHPDPRYAGKTKWSYRNLWNFSIEGISSFSIFPLKIATYLGLLTALAAFIYA